MESKCLSSLHDKRNCCLNILSGKRRWFWLVYCVKRHFQQYFSYIVAVSFMGVLLRTFTECKSYKRFANCISYSPFSTIFLLDFGTVLTLQYLFCFSLYLGFSIFFDYIFIAMTYHIHRVLICVSFDQCRIYHCA
jgi:hypothetical protein